MESVMNWETHFDGHEFVLFEANPDNPGENGLLKNKTKFQIKKQGSAWVLQNKTDMAGWNPDKTDLYADPNSNDGDFRLYGVVYLNNTPHLLSIKEHPSGAPKEIFFKYMDLTGGVSPGGTGGSRR